MCLLSIISFYHIKGIFSSLDELRRAETCQDTPLTVLMKGGSNIVPKDLTLQNK